MTETTALIVVSVEATVERDEMEKAA